MNEGGKTEKAKTKKNKYINPKLGVLSNPLVYI
jgi:hypothetical protein